MTVQLLDDLPVLVSSGKTISNPVSRVDAFDGKARTDDKNQVSTTITTHKSSIPPKVFYSRNASQLPIEHGTFSRMLIFLTY